MQNSEKVLNTLKIPHYKLLSSILLATSISTAGWLLIIFKIDVYETTSIGLNLFFISGFLSLSGIYCLILFMMKRWKNDDKVYIKDISISLRQGVLLSICTLLCLGLLMLDLLRLWNGLLLVSITTLIEFYMSSKDDL
jgi:hypothetical protein